MFEHFVWVLALTNPALSQLKDGIMNLLLISVVSTRELCQEVVKLAVIFMVVRYKHMIDNLVKKRHFCLFKALLIRFVFKTFHIQILIYDETAKELTPLLA